MLIYSLALNFAFQLKIIQLNCLLIYIKDISRLDNGLSDILANTLEEGRINVKTCNITEIIRWMITSLIIHAILTLSRRDKYFFVTEGHNFTLVQLIASEAL